MLPLESRMTRKTVLSGSGRGRWRRASNGTSPAAYFMTPGLEGDQSPQHHLLIASRFHRHACQVQQCLIRKRAKQHAHAPLTVGFARANRNPTNRAHTSGWLLAHPSDLSQRLLSIGNPVLDSSRQQTRLLPRTRFAQHLIALFQEPIQVGHASASSVDVHQRTLTLLSVELQRVLSSADQGLQGSIELAIAGKETIHDHFLIVPSQYPPKLPPASIARGVSKIAFRGKRC